MTGPQATSLEVITLGQGPGEVSSPSDPSGLDGSLGLLGVQPEGGGQRATPRPLRRLWWAKASPVEVFSG